MSERSSASVLRGLRLAIDALVAEDPAAFADGESVAALTTELARLDAVACRQAEEFRLTDDWVDVGAQSSPAWVATRCRVPKRVAQQRLRLGRFCRRYDVVAAAFSSGAISVDHVDVLHAACNRNRFTRGAFNEQEATLVAWAETLRFDEFRHAVDHWLYAADQTGSEHHAERQRAQRRLHLSQSFDNLWFLNGVLDPVDGEIVHTTIERVTNELRQDDRAKTRALLGRDPTEDEVAEHTRTPAQRRADALVEIMIRAQTAPKGGRRPQPLFTVVLDTQAFRRTCELASGTIATPGLLARRLDESLIERIIFDGPDRVLSVGYQRTFRGALERAIKVRDRTCRHPYCDVPAWLCQLDHVQPYALGGKTMLANGRALCGFHNHARVAAGPKRRVTADDQSPPDDLGP